jgi:uncharacterized membrane protein
MDDVILARVLHVLGVVLWIGGVAMVTTVLLPSTKRIKTPAERIVFFESIERGFAMQARITTLVTGLSGFYLVYKLNLWQRFMHVEYWWMHAMVFVWVLFTLMLFVVEPLSLHHRFMGHGSRDPITMFSRASRMHWVLLILSLATIAGAVAGSHGYLLFAA